MKRAQIWIVITLMSIALIGLISFQLYWINNALKINTQRFKSDVQGSLQRVANKLEMHQMAAHFNDFVNIEADSGIFVIRSSGISVSDTLSSKRTMISGSVNMNDSLRNITFIQSESGFKKQIDDKQGVTRFKLPSEEEWTDSSHNIRLRSKSQVVELLVSQLENEHFPIWVPEKEMVDSLLHRELDEKGIDISYTFAVIQHEPDTVLFTNHPKAIEEYSEFEFQASLNPNDILGNLNYLAVNFPSQNQFLFKQIWVTLASSVILLLTIIFCFGYALQTIIRQKKLSEIKNDFINNMTHEFKTPVATISLASEALREQEVYTDKSTLFRYLDIIRDENSRLGTQVEKVLQSATMDRGDYKLNIEVIDLVLILRQIRQSFSISLEKSGGEIKFECDLQSAYVKADEHHLISSINNLVDNAIKYSEEAPIVEIQLSAHEDSYILDVRDKGIGLTNESLKRVFDKFYRVPTGNLHNVKGFGLGLSYVHSIIEMLGGKVTAVSSMGKGSTFTIKLPKDEF